MAKRFCEEALKRKAEVDYSLIKPYICKLLDNLDAALNDEDTSRVAENALRMSVQFQNYTQVFMTTALSISPNSVSF